MYVIQLLMSFNLGIGNHTLICVGIRLLLAMELMRNTYILVCVCVCVGWSSAKIHVWIVSITGCADQYLK